MMRVLGVLCFVGGCVGEGVGSRTVSQRLCGLENCPPHLPPWQQALNIQLKPWKYEKGVCDHNEKLVSQQCSATHTCLEQVIQLYYGIHTSKLGQAALQKQV